MQRKARKQFFTALALALALGAPVAVLAYAQILTAVWIPAMLALLLIGLPPVAYTVARSMLLGLFDLDLSPVKHLPIRVFFTTLAAYCVAATAYVTARLMSLAWPARTGNPPLHFVHGAAVWLHPAGHVAAALLIVAVLNGLAIYFAGWAIGISRGQDARRSLGRMICGMAAALVVANGFLWLFLGVLSAAAAELARGIEASFLGAWLGRGYAGPFLTMHIEAAFAALVTLGLYAGLGVYGGRALGRKPTVAAVVGVLMAVMVLGWGAPALVFWLGRWHEPLLLVVVVCAVLVKYFHGADHTYEMIARASAPLPAPNTVLTANKRKCAILVAAAGGGIQAAAWTAQVLKGLHDDRGAEFDRSLAALSGISGGSVGCACYAHWLTNGNATANQAARDPVKAAADSSLDEVAWGLAWPDLIRLFAPWLVADRMDRALAMERAWAGNLSAQHDPASSPLWQALSEWNGKAATGALPAIFMGSTMVNTGGPLILGTSRVSGSAGHPISADWLEGDRLHVRGSEPMDIPVLRAARLSASFPFVSPAARPREANRQPHMADGGFFDNYGTATLTEWLDQALEGQQSVGGSVERVLLIQTQGFPRGAETLPAPEASHEGWPFQMAAPLVTLANFRNAGQGSHRGNELGLLKQKWAERGVEIDESVFEFNQGDAPLSWHLMPKQKAALAEAWAGAFDTEDSSVTHERERVRKFLAGC
jgi:hypothetical protein